MSTGQVLGNFFDENFKVIQIVLQKGMDSFVIDGVIEVDNPVSKPGQIDKILFFILG